MQNFTKPKVEKHKHKKVKLAVLKYYKVDENNKITRLRRECTNPNCGAATFMAIHYDRYTCGRCGYTLVYQEDKTEVGLLPCRSFAEKLLSMSRRRPLARRRLARLRPRARPERRAVSFALARCTSLISDRVSRVADAGKKEGGKKEGGKKEGGKAEGKKEAGKAPAKKA